MSRVDDIVLAVATSADKIYCEMTTLPGINFSESEYFIEEQKNPRHTHVHTQSKKKVQQKNT